jgi:hypothetical protein
MKILTGMRNLLKAAIKTREDGRLFERVPAKLTVRYQNLYSKTWGLVQTSDISAKGIGLLSGNQIPMHAPLEIWLPIPDMGESLYTQGKVVWSKSMWFNKYRMGICLEKPDMVNLVSIFRQRSYRSSWSYSATSSR